MTGDNKDLTVAPGRMYVDGILCELHPERVGLAAVAGSPGQVEVARYRPDGRAFDAGQWVRVFTPAGVNSCFDSAGGACASNVFCGYHSGFTGGHGDAIYANLPYAARAGCDVGQVPKSGDEMR